MSALAQKEVDLNLGQEDLRLTGASGDQAGTSIAAGDLDGDGFSDLIVGAPRSQVGDKANAGRVYVVFGSAALSAGDIQLAASADITILGATAEDRLGEAVSSMDLNADGFDDVIMGAPKAANGDLAEAGKAYVLYGGPRESLPIAAPLDLAQPDVALALQIWGSGQTNFLGTSFASGDINGDGQDDLIIGASEAWVDGLEAAGATYIVLGGSQLSTPDTLDLATAPQSVDVTISGRTAYSFSGQVVAAGDVDDDGYDDVIIGANGAAPNGASSGEVYVVFGDSSLADSVDLNVDAGITIRGAEARNYLGWDVSAGDFNLDGFDDLLLGAIGAAGYGGHTYVFYGRTRESWPAVLDLASDPDLADVRIEGADVATSGRAVTRLNFNGDGFDEIVTAAPAADPQGRTDAGVVYGIYGGPDIDSQIELTVVLPSFALSVEGGTAGDAIGLDVDAGDINGDGVEDLLIGARAAAGAAGEAYVILGVVPRLDVSVASATTTYQQPLSLDVNIDYTSGMMIVTADMRVVFDGRLLSFTGVELTGGLIADWAVEYALAAGVESTVDTVMLHVVKPAAETPLTSTGKFLTLDFAVNNLRHATTDTVDIDLLSFNGGRTSWNVITPGVVTLVGNSGTVQASVVAAVGDTVCLLVTDPDLNASTEQVDTVRVQVRNSRTDTAVFISLAENGVDDEAFFGRLLTCFADASSASDGELTQLATEVGDTLIVTYLDSLDQAGESAERSSLNRILQLGDVDDNGEAQAYDAAQILRHVLGMVTFQERDSLVANVDLLAPDGPVSSYDAALVIQRRLGLIARFPVQSTASTNHPSPGSPSGRVLAEERRVSLIPAEDGWILWADRRDEIVAGDLLLRDVRGLVVPGEEYTGYQFLSAGQGEDLRLVFAGAVPVRGPGPVCRIRADFVPNAGVQVSGAFNGGTLKVVQDVAAPQLPKCFALRANAPNPFNAGTLIRFDLPADEVVTLQVFNALGQRVRTLVDDVLPAGTHQVAWDGRGAQGRMLASGVYLYRITAGTHTRTRRMLLTK